MTLIDSSRVQVPATVTITVVGNDGEKLPYTFRNVGLFGFGVMCGGEGYAAFGGSPDGRVNMLAVFFKSFAAWCHDVGVPPPSPREVVDALNSLGQSGNSDEPSSERRGKEWSEGRGEEPREGPSS